MMLDKLKISQKVYLLGLSQLFLMMVMGLVSLSQMNKIGVELMDIAEQDIPLNNALAQITTHKQLKLINERIFPQDYARTLQEWRLRFWEKWSEVRALGFDERFKRMWEFYFHYCEAGFKTEGIDVRQMFYQRN